MRWNNTNVSVDLFSHNDLHVNTYSLQSPSAIKLRIIFHHILSKKSIPFYMGNIPDVTCYNFASPPFMGHMPEGVYVVVQFCPWCKFYFPLFKTYYHTLSYITIPQKQRKVKFASRTNQNICTTTTKNAFTSTCTICSMEI